MQQGIYRYLVYNLFSDSYASYTMQVEIVRETEKSYLVEYKGFHAKGSRPGERAWVAKKSVTVTQEKPLYEPQDYPF